MPKGFFPVQDTGVILGVSEGAADISFAAMAERQQALAEVDPARIPAVESLSSFIGVDGTNTTLNSGRIQINLKPLERARDRPRPRSSAGCSPELAEVAGITLYMQPVQDLTVEDRVSRTQYQYTLEDADAEELRDVGAAAASSGCSTLPELRDVASDQQNDGARVPLVIDRDTASRLGITPQMIDDTLYNAFGQRQVSTIFTQLNQYRVVLEVEPDVQQNPEALKRPLRATPRRPASHGRRSSAFTRGVARTRAQHAPLAINHQGQFPVVTLSFNLAPGVVARRRRRAPSEGDQRQLGLPASIHAELPGHRAGVPGVARERAAADPRRARHGLHRARRALRELHPPDHDPLDAAVGRRRRAARAACSAGTDLSVIALIGIILLIGIVKKNAIMMIDFALEAERDEGKSPDEAIYQACLLRFRPIMMTTMAALLGALPLALGTGIGSELRRPLGITIVGGLLVSQVLTLYTTPVIYLCVRPARGTVRRGSRGSEHGRRAAGERHEPLRAVHPPARSRTTLLTVAIALAGALALQPAAGGRRCRRSTSRRSQVSASLPGASPETMASAVATPLERQFGRIAGVTEMTSTSSLGSTQVTLQFDLDRDIDAAARDVQAAINAARGQLPANLPSNPTLSQGQPGRRADPDPGAHVRRRRRGRRCTTRRRPILAQKLSQVDGRRPGRRRRRRAAGGARRGEPDAAAPTTASASRRCARRLASGQRQPAEGRAGRRRRQRGLITPTTSCSRPRSTGR